MTEEQYKHLTGKFQDLKCKSCFSNNKSTLISGLHSLPMRIWSLVETIGILSSLLSVTDSLDT